MNSGKILKLWTNAAARPTLHRVVGIVEDRISLPLFLHPNWDFLIAPLPTVGGEGAVHMQSFFLTPFSAS